MSDLGNVPPAGLTLAHVRLIRNYKINVFYQLVKSHEVAKKGKPFLEGEFVKESLVDFAAYSIPRRKVHSSKSSCPGKP